jgi:hypothetical protein
MKGALVDIANFKPDAWNYYPDVWDTLIDLGVTHIWIQGGGDGEVFKINIRQFPNQWAQNLYDFASQADSYGIKICLFSLGNGWSNDLGIVPPYAPYNTRKISSVTLYQAKNLIDKLAGDNPLQHNFLTDDRFFGWRPLNEPDFANEGLLNWGIELCDYIRSKGGKAWIASPRVLTWKEGKSFANTEPLLRGHVDYLEMHQYGVKEFVQFNYDYDAFYTWYKSKLQERMIDPRGDFSLDQIILGEFGIWREYMSDVGYAGQFTDRQRETYYRAVYNAAADVGIKNIFFFRVYSRKIEDTNIIDTSWGIMDPNGNPLPYVYDFLKDNYN